MLEYDTTDISEGIDVNKTNVTKECDICHYWYLNILVLNMSQKILVLNMSQIFAMVVMI